MADRQRYRALWLLSGLHIALGVIVLLVLACAGGDPAIDLASCGAMSQTLSDSSLACGTWTYPGTGSVACADATHCRCAWPCLPCGKDHVTLTADFQWSPTAGRWTDSEWTEGVGAWVQTTDLVATRCQ